MPDTKMAMRKIEKCIGPNHEIHIPEGTELIEVSRGLSTYPKQAHSTALHCMSHAILHTHSLLPQMGTNQFLTPYISSRSPLDAISKSSRLKSTAFLTPVTKSQKSVASSRTHHHSNTNSILRRSQGLSPLIETTSRLVFWSIWLGTLSNKLMCSSQLSSFANMWLHHLLESEWGGGNHCISAIINVIYNKAQTHERYQLVYVLCI